MVGLVLSVATVGCVKTDDPSANQSGMVTLQLSNGTLTTRAVGNNDNTNNEDLIVDAQVFFFDSNANNATVKYSYYTNIADVKETATISIPLTTEQLTSLFPGGNGYVYVIANYGSEITGATTLAALKAKAIASTFGTDEDGVQPSFIMDSDLTTVARGTANTISGEVFLTRAAAKVELTVNVDPITQEDGKTWIADTANMRLSFNNGVSDGVIDDGSDEEGAEPANGGTTFDIAGRGFTLVTGAAGNGSFVQSVPFYSYSTKWTTGAENEVYLELAIPWAVKTEGDAEPTYQTFYYQVPVSADKMSLVRNAYYKLTLDVGVLGGLTEPVTVEPSYVVLDWGTNNVNVTLSRPKYLVVDENSVVMNNINSYSVGYQSSDAISVAITKIEYPNLKTGDTTTAYNNTTGTTSTNGFTVSKNDNVVTLNHVLDNDRTDGEYDYFPYTVTVVVKNTVSGFSETIVFKQYPAIYVEADKNTDYDDGSSRFSDTNDNKGYTFVNNGNGSNYGSNSGMSSNASNKNPSMYTITVSALDSDEFIIGDPRSTSISNPTGSTTAPALYDGAKNRQLKYYYPTAPASDKIIAPKFRIASSYGVTSEITYANAQKRCAFYQEDGYPAGRWRMPTPAEIKYMIQFANEGKITVLLTPGYYYWSGYQNTAYTYEDGDIDSKTSGSAYVRCVYDEWYWGSEKACDIETFTWGDEPR